MTDEVQTAASPSPNYGVMIGSGIVLAVIVLGGLFLWGKAVTPQSDLTVEDAAPVEFEVMTSHVTEPNIDESSEQLPQDEIAPEETESTFE
jgi:hypothetical protein